MKIISLFFWIVAGTLLFVKRAHAYIDPGTGSYFIQILLGLGFGLLFSAKMLWRRLVRFFKNIRKSKVETANRTQSSDAALSDNSGVSETKDKTL